MRTVLGIGHTPVANADGTVAEIFDIYILDNIEDALDVFSEQSMWFDRILFGVESRKLRVAGVVGDK